MPAPSQRRTRAGGTQGPIEYDSVRALARDFGTMPAELRTRLRPELKRAAMVIAQQAKSNAAYSERIPGAITVGVSFARKNGGARVRVSSKKAPHARPLEGIADRRPSFRHPVFGDRENWVAQPSRPFLAPAVAAKRGEALERIRSAVRSTTTHLGSST